MESFGEGQYVSVENFNEIHPHFGQVMNLETSSLAWKCQFELRKIMFSFAISIKLDATELLPNYNAKNYFEINYLENKFPY